MTAYIPYTDRFSVGDTLDWTRESLRGNSKPARVGTSKNIIDNPQVETRFKIITSTKDVVELLEIPPELVIKLKIGHVEIPVINEIVKDLHNENVATIVFQVRIRLIKENILATRVSESDYDFYSSKAKKADTNKFSEVTAIEWGDEAIVIIKLRKKEISNVKSNDGSISMLSSILSSRMSLDDKIEMLSSCWATHLDTEISRDDPVTQMTVKCFGFHVLPQDVSTASGCVSLIKMLREKFQQSATISSMPERASFDNTPIHQFEGKGTSQGNPITSPQSTEPDITYQLRISIQEYIGEDSLDARCNFVEEIVKAEHVVAKIIGKIPQLNDQNVAVIRKSDDYDIWKRTHKMESLQREIQKSAKTMALGVASNKSLETICQDVNERGDRLQIFCGKPLSVALLGKTGHGKSSTGNSILEKNLFATSADPMSETSSLELGEKIIDGRELRVVDTPGLYDTRNQTTTEMKKEALKFLTSLITMSPEGYDAFLFVIQYGTKMTLEEKDTIELFEKFFGESVISSNAIFVITGGDKFKTSSKTAFDSWCRNTGSPELDILFKKCKYKCVLFDNETQDEDEKKNQFIRLVSLVDTIDSRYNVECFQYAQASREKLRQEIMSPERKADIHEFLNSFHNCLEADTEISSKTLDRFLEIQSEADLLSDRDQSEIFPFIESLKRSCEQKEEDKTRKIREEEEHIQRKRMDYILNGLKLKGDLIKKNAMGYQESLRMLEDYREKAKDLPQHFLSDVMGEINRIQSICETYECNRVLKEQEQQEAREYRAGVDELLDNLHNISLLLTDDNGLDESKLSMLDGIQEIAKTLKKHDGDSIVKKIGEIKSSNDKVKKKQTEDGPANQYSQNMIDMSNALAQLSSLVVVGAELNREQLDVLEEVKTEANSLEPKDKKRFQHAIERTQQFHTTNATKREEAESKNSKDEEYRVKMDKIQRELIILIEYVGNGGIMDHKQCETLDRFELPENLKSYDAKNVLKQISYIKEQEKRNIEKSNKIEWQQKVTGDVIQLLSEIKETIHSKKTIEVDVMDKLQDLDSEMDNFPEEYKKRVLEEKKAIIILITKQPIAAVAKNRADLNRKFENFIQQYNKDCFSADDVVETADGSKLKMENLAVGDLVLARDRHGKLFYDTVYMFGHRDMGGFSEFVTIETAHQKVSVTERHLVFCIQDDFERCVPAGCVQPGDRLIVSVSGHSFEHVPVLKVTREVKRGLFAPFTKSGTVVVNGALMSCYIDIVPHQTAHISLWPFRQLYDIEPSALSLVNSTSNNSTVPLWADKALNAISYLKNTTNRLLKYLT